METSIFSLHMHGIFIKFMCEKHHRDRLSIYDVHYKQYVGLITTQVNLIPTASA